MLSVLVFQLMNLILGFVRNELTSMYSFTDQFFGVQSQGLVYYG